MYRFIYQSIHGVQYTVNIMQSGSSGSVTTRNLGKAPVLHMKDGDPFRATSCDLVLECQTDGEFASFYTSNPLEYKVAVFRGNTQVWTGFLATEIYSEPNIAPPYDVSVTATDGLGTLKEYIFEPVGLQPLGTHMVDLLRKTGLDLAIDFAMTLSKAGGTVPDFLDTVSINLDYLAGENCYTVLETLLVSLHATITQYDGRWLVIRETDISVGGSNIPVYRKPSRTGSTSATSISGGRRSVGKMGTADMWPVGYTTRKAVPAKRRITVEAPWHLANAAPSVQDDDYSTSNASFVDVGGGDSRYDIVGVRQSSSVTYGYVFCGIGLSRFTRAIAVTVRVSAGAPNPVSWGIGKIGVSAKLTDGSTEYYWDGTEWLSAVPQYPFLQTNAPTEDVNVNTEKASEASDVTFCIPAHGETSSRALYVYVYGMGARVFNVDIRPVMDNGFRDEILINNGARGDGDKVSITGGRMTEEYFEIPDSYLGIWRESSSDSSHPVYLFTDSNFGSKDFMSIQALGRALSVAAHRVETYGTIDFPANMSLPPIAIRANSSNALVTSYDWDMYNEEFKFNAVTLPSASLSVTSETVTSMENTGNSYSGGSSGVNAGSALPEVTGTDDGKVLTVVNGAWDKAAVPTELPSVGTSDNGKVLMVVAGSWIKNSIPDQLPTVTASDAGKILQVSTNGFWEAATPSGGGSVTVDSQLSSTSENPVQNKAIYAAIGDIESLLSAI